MYAREYVCMSGRTSPSVWEKSYWTCLLKRTEILARDILTNGANANALKKGIR